MSVVICPGMHDPELTRSFVLGLQCEASDGVNKPKVRDTPLSHGQASSNFVNLLIFPAQDYAVLSAFHIVQFLRDSLGSPQTASPTVFISFSAGVVGAIGAAWGWQLLGGKVKAFIALDGWGVPLGKSNFPIHRLSHDHFTHWSSAVLGSGEDNFYAEPPVAHLEMWRSPQTVEGWWVKSIGKSQQLKRLTAAEFLTMLLELYAEI